MIGVFSRERGDAAEPLPRTVHLWVNLAGDDQRPGSGTGAGAGAGLRLDVSLFREGTGVVWHRPATLSVADLAAVEAAVAGLHLWTTDQPIGRRTVAGLLRSVGPLLSRRVLGTEGRALLAELDPTALLVCIDEELVGLPWEMLDDPADPGRPLVARVPVGRLVRSRTRPAGGRDPLTEDPDVRILVVAPADDLSGTAREREQLAGLAGSRGGVTVEVEVLAGTDATLAALADRVRGRDFDVLHLAGHGRFLDSAPARAGFQMADGWLDGKALSALEWAKPPAVVVNSSCQSSRVAAGRGLLAGTGSRRGLPATTLAMGSAAYLGHFWPVRDQTAATFAGAFYDTLLDTWDAGIAVTEARRAIVPHFDDSADPALVGAVLYGDVATATVGGRPGLRPRSSFPAEAV